MNRFAQPNRLMAAPPLPPMLRPVKMKAVAGVMNKDVLVDVWEDTSFDEDRVVKLNRLTILAYKPFKQYNYSDISETEITLYKLWTSGGFQFYTNNTKFMKDEDEEEGDGDKDKDLETRESGVQSNSDKGGV